MGPVAPILFWGDNQPVFICNVLWKWLWFLLVIQSKVLLIVCFMTYLCNMWCKFLLKVSEKYLLFPFPSSWTPWFAVIPDKVNGLKWTLASLELGSDSSLPHSFIVTTIWNGNNSLLRSSYATAPGMVRKIDDHYRHDVRPLGCVD